MRAWLLVLAACGSTAKPKPAPPPASCEDATLHYEGSVDAPSDQRVRVRASIVKRCTDDAWPVEARNCMAKTQPLDDQRECLAKLTPPQRDALDRDLASITHPPPPPPSTLSPCEQYQQRLEQITKCEKLPQASRDALARAFEATKESFEFAKNDTEEIRAQLDDACKQALDSLNASLSGTCPP